MNRGTATGPGADAAPTPTPESTAIPERGPTTEPRKTTRPGPTTEPGPTTGPGAAAEPGTTTRPGPTTEPGPTTGPGAAAEPGTTTGAGAGAEESVARRGGRRRGGWRRVRWKAVVGLAGLAGLGVAVASTVDDVREQALPGAGPLAGALALQVLALAFAGRSWVALFPPGADRRGLARGLYTSQLTKYLPAGGFAQAASQVALASPNGGVAAAAVRLPLFSLCSVLAGVTCGSVLAVDGDLPLWARVLSVLSLSALATLDRRVLQAGLRLGRRVVRRLPPPERLPDQRAIVTCYLFALGNTAAFATAYVVLLGDLADVSPVGAGAALATGWVVGYLAVPVPSGLAVREAVVVATLPSLAAGPLLAASVAHRLVGLLAEALLAGVTSGRAALARPLPRPVPVVDPVQPSEGPTTETDR